MSSSLPFALLSPGGLGSNRLSGFNHRFSFSFFLFTAQCRLFLLQSKPLTPRSDFSNYSFSFFPTGEGAACRSAALLNHPNLFFTMHVSQQLLLLFVKVFLHGSCSRLPTLAVTPRLCRGVTHQPSLGLRPHSCSHLASASISSLSPPEKPI